MAFSGLASGRYPRAATRACLQVIRAVRPEALFTDQDPVTLLAGQITGLPTAITYASVMERDRGSLPCRAIRRRKTPSCASTRRHLATRASCTSAPTR